MSSHNAIFVLTISITYAINCRTWDAHWTLRLLEKRVVELGIVEAASYTTIYRVLKENQLKPHKNKYWVIPPEKDADFVAAMEDTLEVYTRPRDPARPVICLDETSKQLTREKRTPLPRGPGREERIDYEYERAGVANVFMLFVPLEGKRHVCVRKRRTAKDYAEVVRELVDVHFPLAEKIILVNDNLNTHKIASYCTRHSHLPRPSASRNASRCTTPQNMGLGSIWPNANSAYSPDNASPGASLIRQN